jgi:LCP family protein required for cell wall assembly
MRTTLKRGIGRAAGGLNGNGHSALPPLFGPITLYRQPERPRRSIVGLILRGFGWVILAAVVLGSGVAGGYYLYIHRTVGELKASNNSATGKAQGALKGNRNGIVDPSKPAVALIAGYDHRAGTGTRSFAGSNSDTLMLVRADPKNHTLSLLSFPRDLYVPVYCHAGAASTTDRINSAWSLCGNNGPTATVLTMEHLTGLKINYLITLDFHAFKQLVNRLHGVYLNVDRRYYNPLHTGYSAINLQPGYQKLDGGQALSYVRFRHLDSDIYRTGRQQLFIEALKARMRTQLSLSSLPLELPRLIGVLKHNLEYVKAGGGTVSLGELESYLGIAYHLPPGHLFRNQIPIADLQNFVTPGGADVLQASPGAIPGAVHNFLHPDIRQSGAVNAQFFGVPKKKTAKKNQHKLPRSKITVLVLNAGTIPGEASNTSYLLGKRGYSPRSLPATRSANTPSTARGTTVYYDPVQPNAQQAAQQLRPLFGSHTRVAQMTTVIAEYAKLAGNPLTVVAVGTRFSGKLVVHHPPKVAPKLPPQVSPGFSVAAPALRSVAGRSGVVPLMVPYRIAQGSTLSQLGRVRSFRPLPHQHEVALQFVMPNGIQYWQVEETTWNSAPILANPTGEFFYHHEKFLVYTTGGAIQMVVLMRPKQSYWVVNTILNQLSNSTMIAIAESLKPLRR